MTRAMRLAVALVVGLAAMTFGAARLVQVQMRAWFDKDVNLRARLAVTGARGELASSWRSDPARLYSVLSEMAQDERIMGACACDGNGATVARGATSAIRARTPAASHALSFSMPPARSTGN